MRSTKETRALAYEVLAYWERFNHHEQESWVGDEDGFKIKKVVLPSGGEVNVCSTTMCAAGTAVFLSTTPKTFRNFVAESGSTEWEEVGGRLLGLDTYEEQNAVFYSDNKSAKRFMKAIASGSQKKFDKANAKRKFVGEGEED